MDTPGIQTSLSSGIADIEMFENISGADEAVKLLTDATTGYLPAVLRNASRYCSVEINFRLLTGRAPVPGQYLCIHLFDGEAYRAKVEKVTRDINNVLSVAALSQNTARGYLIYSVSDQKMEAAISILDGNKEFRITFVSEANRHFLLEVDPNRKDILPESPSLIPD